MLLGQKLEYKTVGERFRQQDNLGSKIKFLNNCIVIFIQFIDAAIVGRLRHHKKKNYLF